MAPSLVQVAANAASAESVTVTLGANTTGGNTLVAMTGDPSDGTIGTVSGITLGGSADNWAEVKSYSNNGHALVTGWADANCAGGQTAVAVTLSGGNSDKLFAWAMEWTGLTGTLDASSGGDNGFSATWTSGASGTTAQASEVAFGVTAGAVQTGTSGALTGPSSPWVNEAQQTLTGSSHEKNAICGYQILSSAGTVTYSGTSSPSTTNDTIVFTLEATSGTAHTRTAALTVTPALTATPAHGHYRTAALTVTPTLAANRVQGHARQAALTVNPTLSATPVHGHTRAAALAVTPGFTVTRTQAHVRTAALAVTPGFTVARTQAHVRTAALTVTPAGRAVPSGGAGGGLSRLLNTYDVIESVYDVTTGILGTGGIRTPQ